MGRREKRLERIKNNPRQVRPEDLEAALLAEGFVKRQGKGDHVVFSKGSSILTIDYRRPFLLPVYVTKALKAIEGEQTDGEG